MSKSFLGKRSWHKKLAVAVTAGLMSGMYIPGVFAAEYNRNDTGISVDFKGTSDADWLGSDIVSVDKDGEQINVKYSFDGDNSFNITGTTDATAISIIDDPNVVIDVANGGTLKLNSSASVSGSNASAAGLSIAVEEVGANVTVNGNLDIAAHSNSAFASGISMGISGTGEGGEAHLTINGDVTMRNKDNPDSPWGVTAKNIHGGLGPDGWAGDDGFGGADYTGARWAPGGISLGSGHGSTIDINGNVDLAVAGSAVVTNNYYADEKITDNRKLGIINLNGGNVTIDTPESTTETYYALANYGGTINVNMDGDQAGANDVNITGNIISMKEDNGSGRPYFYADGQINLALATANSSWTGVIDNSGAAQAGEVNLYLQNGASWQHESLSKTNGMQVENMPNPSADHYGRYDNVSHVSSLNGGSDAAHAGYIMQKDSAEIAVDNYSGHTVVLYEHENDGDSTSDYKAGDLIIKKAAAASGITLSTDSNGITMNDSDLVSRVLNTLAGKLTYSAFVTGETNLSGKVQIADGLTSSSAAMKVGNIIFNEATGKGGYVSEEQPEYPVYSQTLTGDTTADTEYSSIIKDGKYVFAEDSVIDVTDKAAIDAKKQLTVDAGNNTLDLKVSGTSGDLAAIKADYSNVWSGNFNNTISAGKINITVENTGDGATVGIKNGQNTLTVNSDVVINAQGEKNASGVISDYLGTTVNGDVDITVAANGSGSSANGVAVKYGGSFKADNANINVTTNGSGAALSATYGYSNGMNGEGKSIIDIGGGTIKINSTGEEPVYSILVEKESDNANATQEVYINKDATAKKVDIHGNVKLTGNSSDLIMGLATADSKLNGVIFSKEYEETVWEGWTPVTKTDTPDVFLTLKNGAVWNNEVQGNIDQDFNGSYVSDFTGGDSADNAGYILQNDGRRLTLENYAGHSVIVYEHTDDGTSAEHYAAGDTIIKNAAEGSGIVLSTGNNGIVMNNEEQVAKTLNTLAGKLTYNAYTSGEKNLAGKVQIVDGLTSSSASLKIGDIVFDNDTGKGGYGDLNQTTKDFTAQLTGGGSDTSYQEAHVIQEDGSYKFMKDSSITMTDGTSAIDVKGDVVIDAAGSSLTLKTDGSNNVYGISQSSGNAAKITADTINIDVTSASRAEGIHLMGSSKEQAADVELNGDVNVNVSGVGYTLGVYAAGNSTLNVNGNMTMKGSGEDKWGIDDAGAGDGYYGSSALYAGSNYVIQKGGTINVNGSVDLVVNGNGAFANGGGSAINIDGGSIEINSERQLYALIAQSGYINMNMNDAGDGAGSNKVNIKGNVGVMNGSVNSNEPCKDSIINLGLSTKDSTWTGVIDNNFTENQVADGWTGTVNLYMSNGATWTNEAYGKTDRKFSGSTVENFVGGASVDKAGNIFQKDSNNLTFNNYSGYTNIYYAHGNAGTAAEDYKAGDTIVKHAATGSGISLITDNSNIDMGSIETINSVLNALAGKLTYSAFVSGEKNLAGKVQIADGLTSSSAALQVGDITFDENTGKGSYEEKLPDAEQSKAEFTDVITGVRGDNTDYIMSGVLKEDGSYVFTMDSTVLPGINVSSTIDHDLVINAADKTLNMKNISNNTKNKLNVTAGNINIVNATKGGRTEGIHANGTQSDSKYDIVINGDTNVNVSGYDYTLGTYAAGNSEVTFNGDVTMKGSGENKWGVDDHGQGYGYYGSSALYAGSNYGIQKGGTINVNGNVDLVVNGNGAFANGGGSTINIDGGSIEINSERQLYALIAQSGYINMNMNDAGDGAGSNKVNIKGNVGVMNGSVNSNEPCKDSIINLGLSTKDSTWTGVIDNNFTENQVADGWTGTVNLYMSNGATWTNEAYGKTDRKFSGSTVENFVGGASVDKAGNIFQKDSNNLTFNNYSGYTNIYYAHDNAGTAAEDYKAGDTIVKHAATGSGISLITDNSGIDMKSTEAIEATLSALAQKLTYEAYKEGEKNLSGKVQIASGLTSSSAALQTGDIEFASDGKGGYVDGSLTPGAEGDNPGGEGDNPGGEGDNPGGDVEIGNYESDIMKGARSAMMTSMLSWRDNAADIYSRGSAVRDGAEEGAWARSFGGKAKYDGSSTSMENSYWAGQVGYDRMLANGWTLGAAIDYRDGNATYLNGGKGDNKLYSFGIYASKELGDNAYLDMAVKAGKVENEYSVYNIIGQKLDGDYSTRGYSVSAQYSKRFGEETKGYVEPQLQLTWSHLDSESYNTYSGSNVMNIRQDAFNSFVGRIGVQTGVETERGGLFAKLSVAHEFSGDVEGSYNANDGGLKTTKYDLGGTWSELTLGGSYKLSKCSNFYADITRSLSGDYQHQWKLNAGLNFSF